MRPRAGRCRTAVGCFDNYAEHLPERRRMMQAWVDYADRSRAKRN
jgi:hypothetical protein